MSGLKSGLEEICQGRDELLAVKEREMALKYSKIVAIEVSRMPESSSSGYIQRSYI